MFNLFNFLNEIKFENRNYGLFFSFSNWQYFYSPGLSIDSDKIFMGIHSDDPRKFCQGIPQQA